MISLTNAAVAQTLGKDIVELEKRCERLEAEIAELRGLLGCGRCRPTRTR